MCLVFYALEKLQFGRLLDYSNTDFSMFYCSNFPLFYSIFTNSFRRSDRVIIRSNMGEICAIATDFSVNFYSVEIHPEF